MSITAAEIMTRQVVTARPDDTIKTVAQRLIDHDISALPVCDERGKLLGMLSEGDIMRPFSQNNMQKRARWLTLLAEGHELAPNFVDYISLGAQRARDLMTKPVITAADQATVPELADLMTDHKIKRLPILREGQLVGIVSRADVVRALARMPADAVVE